jgi:hypothetical protein
MVVFGLTTWGRGAEPASAESVDHIVLDWNRYAYEALGNAPTAATPGMGQSPVVSSLHLAIVQGAVYDAVNMIDGSYEPYNDGLPSAPASASMAAAVATAAHHVLVGINMVPPLSPAIATRLDTLLADSIADATSADGADAVADGIAAGTAAADAMLAARANDGRYGTFSFTTGTGPGEWRPTPPSNLNDPFAWAALVDPFVIESASDYRTKGPHALKTGIYAKEYNEVKTLGGPTATSPRTAEQETIAQFYVVNPAEMFPRAFRTIAADAGLTIPEQARLFAMLSMATADALIATWDDKAHWVFWRPITAIHNGDSDGNHKTIGDPTWTPLLNTPPYPDHPSGYNAISGAVMATAEAFFGTKKFNFSLVRIVPGVPDVTREYTRFWDVVQETIDARIYQGLHFRAAEEQAARMGADIAHWISRNAFQPAN